MFGFKKKESQSQQVVEKEKPLPKGYTPKKGAPTPTRKEAQARHYHPLVADKTKLTREQKKERRARARAASDAQWQREQKAMREGDEAHMPYQHKGKVRKFGRDYIDASAPISGWFMPVAILLIPFMFLTGRFPALSFYGTIFFYGIFVLMLIHALYIVGKSKKLAAFKFGSANVPRGFRWQMLGRAFYLRRWRLPAAQVKYGEFPEGGTKDDWKRMKAAQKEERAARKQAQKEAGI